MGRRQQNSKLRKNSQNQRRWEKFLKEFEESLNTKEVRKNHDLTIPDWKSKNLARTRGLEMKLYNFN